MPMLPLFDLHCDTLYEALITSQSLSRNNLHLSFSRLAHYQPFCQILAVWSDNRSDGDTDYRRFFEAADKLKAELSDSGIRLCTDDAGLKAADSGAVFLAVEGGKLLGDDLSRLDCLHAAGVRFFTLVWNQTCKIGGAWDTDEGLTPFGRSVVKRCFSLGIIPDLSHASRPMIDEVLDLCQEAGRVCIATHSNSYSVCPHRRNLTDAHFCRIRDLHGLVGISLAPMHLTSDEKCTLDDVAAHIEHYLSLGGEDTVCLGCDLDGVPSLPEGIAHVDDLAGIAEKLGRINYTDELIRKIFYANARNFISLWMK